MQLTQLSPSVPLGTSGRYQYWLACALLPLLLLAACSTDTPPTTSASSAQSYVGAATSTNLSMSTFGIDRVAKTFVQYQNQYVVNSGSFSVLPNGTLNIGLSFVGGNGLQGTLNTPPQMGNWAVEWPGQFGLVGLLGQPVTPIAPNQSCPAVPTSATYRFVTLPIAGDSTGTAYGSASVATSGSTVNFTNISQLAISGAAAANPAPASVTAICSPTVFGNTISAPSTSTVTNPGNGQTATPSATIAIGPTGFLVEDNGYTANPVAYGNVLGAGTGAVGLQAPAAALSTSSLAAAQYTGFIYGTGAAGSTVKNLAAVPATTRIASFGYASISSSCPNPPAAASPTTIFGGEYAKNDPSANAFGNCDIAIDFGQQDARNNGLYPMATVYLGALFPGNTTGKTYSFSAAIVAGQVQGKYALFLIGLDKTGLQIVSQGQQSQDWGIYLLQSNG